MPTLPRRIADLLGVVVREYTERITEIGRARDETDIFEDVREYQNMATDPNADGRSNILLEPEHLDPISVPRSIDRLKALGTVLTTMPPEAAEMHPLYGQARRLYYNSIYLKQLARFVDPRNPTLTEPALPDSYKKSYRHGNDIPLALNYRHRRLFILSLHFPGIIQHDRNIATGSKAYEAMFENIYAISRYLLSLEQVKVPVDVETDQYEVSESDMHGYSVLWIEDVRDAVMELLEAIADLVYQPRPDNPNLSGEEIFSANLQDQAMTDQVTNEINTWNLAEPFARLVCDLLSREEAFEMALSDEHVEDKLTDKQISMVDERSFAFYGVDAPDSVMVIGPPYFEWLGVNLIGLDFKYHSHYVWNQESEEDNIKPRYLQKILADTDKVNRQRRNHRLIREWAGNRPWKTLIQFYDTEKEENRWLLGAIEDFRFSVLINGSEERDIYEFPSSYRNITYKLFGVFPYDLSDLKRLWPEIEFACKLCNRDFIGGNTIDSTAVSLHCHREHNFHVKCIFEYWDQPGKYLHDCPTCGVSAKLNWQRIGWDPTNDGEFVHNNFGYQVPQVRLVTSYKVTDQYDIPPVPTSPNDVRRYGPKSHWLRENMRVACIAAHANEGINWINFRERAGQPIRPSIEMRTSNREYFNTRPRDRDLPAEIAYSNRRALTTIARTYVERNRGMVDVANRENASLVENGMFFMVPGARFNGADEMAVVRASRRRANKRRRRNVRERGGGIGRLR